MVLGSGHHWICIQVDWIQLDLVWNRNVRWYSIHGLLVELLQVNIWRVPWDVDVGSAKVIWNFSGWVLGVMEPFPMIVVGDVCIGCPGVGCALVEAVVRFRIPPFPCCVCLEVSVPFAKGSR